MNIIVNTKQAGLRVTSPTTYRIVRAVLLSREPFRQVDIATQAAASPGQVSQVVRRLVDLGHIKRQTNALYRVQETATIPLSILPFQRRMQDAHAGRLLVRAGRESTRDALVDAGGILCLESALEEVSGHFRADRVCAYHADPAALLAELSPNQGGTLPIDIYTADLPLRGDIEAGRRTTKWRTLVDLACDGKTYAAKDLLFDLWGITIE